MVDVKLIDRSDDCVGNRYIELMVGNKNRAVCVKAKQNGYWYVMDCGDGNNVYDAKYGPERPIGKITREEMNSVKEFVEEQLEAEAALDERAEREGK